MGEKSLTHNTPLVWTFVIKGSGRALVLALPDNPALILENGTVSIIWKLYGTEKLAYAVEQLIVSANPGLMVTKYCETHANFL